MRFSADMCVSTPSPVAQSRFINFCIVKYLPSWVPFKRKAAEGRRMLEALVNKPYERVKADMVRLFFSSAIRASY